jgi:hypothetical protein
MLNILRTDINSSLVCHGLNEKLKLLITLAKLARIFESCKHFISILIFVDKAKSLLL